MRLSTDDSLKQIIEIFSRRSFISGQEVAQKLNIPRASVWKKINKLRRYGYVIKTEKGKGYHMTELTKSPVSWELRRLLCTRIIGKNIFYYCKSVSSTQSIALLIAEQEIEQAEAEGTVVIAETQNDGRGRINRRWISPAGGIWLSVVLN